MTEYRKKGNPGMYVTTGPLANLGFPRKRHVKTRAQLNAELKRLQEAMSEYADPANWRQRGSRKGRFAWYGGGRHGFVFARTAMQLPEVPPSELSEQSAGKDTQ
jgi:hypothetical protein